MASKRVEITVDEGLLAEIDRVRGMVPRAAWVKDALRKALAVSGSSGAVKAREFAESAVAQSIERPAPPRVSPSVSLRDTWSR